MRTVKSKKYWPIQFWRGSGEVLADRCAGGGQSCGAENGGDLTPRFTYLLHTARNESP